MQWIFPSHLSSNGIAYNWHWNSLLIVVVNDVDIFAVDVDTFAVDVDTFAVDVNSSAFDVDFVDIVDVSGVDISVRHIKWKRIL